MEKKFCEKCGKEILNKIGSGRFCSRSCSNSRIQSKEIKEKISNSLKQPPRIKNCLFCKNDFIAFNKKRMFCSNKCCVEFKKIDPTYIKKLKDGGRKGGRKSALSQNRRSKNEIYFSELCKDRFKKVLTNETIFNGWDADIIIEDLKVAILWNGIWHYKKIKKDHSLKQVQSRDKIKQKQIKKHGFIPYVIKDLGKFNKKFVEEQFEIFLNNTSSIPSLL